MANETVTLKEYFDRVMSERDKALQAALASAKEAVTVAENNAEKWRQSANEWRGAMDDKDTKLLMRSEFELHKKLVDDTLGEFKTYKAVADSKADSKSVLMGNLFAIAALIISVYNAFLK